MIIVMIILNITAMIKVMIIIVMIMIYYSTCIRFRYNLYLQADLYLVSLSNGFSLELGEL